MLRIEIGDDGITLTTVTEPRMSVFGKEMSPGGTDVVVLPWDEVSGACLQTLTIPDEEPWTYLVIDLTWGEFYEIQPDAVGFAEAVETLSRTPLWN